MSEILDVVQVGYGPVGQMQAALLGQAGYRIEVVERHRSLYQLARAGHIDHEVMRMLQKIDVAKDLERDVLPVRGQYLLDSDLQVMSGIMMNPWGSCGWHFHYNMYQPVLETAMDGRIRSLPNVTVTQGFEAVALEQHADHVALTIRPTRAEDDSADRVIRARYLIGADGANSSVRALAGMEWVDLGYRGEWLVCDFEHHDHDVELGWAGANHVFDPARPITAARWLGREHSRLEFMLLPGETAAEMSSEDVAWKLSERMNITRETSQLSRHAVYEFRAMIAPEWRSGRVLLIGDAAHIMPPFLGQGMCTGLRDASNLTWRLDLVLRGMADERLLDTYVEERHAHALMVTELSTSLGAMLDVTDSDVAVDRDRSLRSEDEPAAAPEELSGLTTGLLHREPDGSLRAGVGTLALQARVEVDGAVGLLDDVIGAGWQVLCRRSIDDELADDAQHRELLQLLDAKVVVLSPARKPGIACDFDQAYDFWLRDLDAQVIIVRPDFYIFAVLRSVAEVPAALADLRAQLSLTPSDSLDRRGDRGGAVDDGVGRRRVDQSRTTV